MRRFLLFYPCALDLLKNNQIKPVLRKEIKKDSIVVYRFVGKTLDGSMFYVQVKENVSKKQKYFLSVFPYN